jgi:hypothetical protein
MQSRSLVGHKQVWSPVLKTTFLSLLIVASACSRMPNTIPDGYEQVFNKNPAWASTAARVDYPIIYTVNPDDTFVPFRVTKNGERFWFLWDREFLELRLWKSITWYRVAVVADGEPEAICHTEWLKPDSSQNVTEIPCKLSKGTLRRYLSKPLIGFLDYWVGDVDGDENKKPAKDASATGVVDRVYYLIPRQ